MYSPLRILLLASVIWAATLPTAFGADILLEDTFEFFELGETWQEHGAGVPDQALGVIFANDSEVLQMMTSGSSDEFFGVETIAPISIAGLSDRKVDARRRPIRGDPARAQLEQRPAREQPADVPVAAPQ